MIKVELLNSMGDDLAVVNAARVSFSKEHEKLEAGDLGLLRYLADHEHWSPFSHCIAKFRIKAPIFVARQLAKHQVGFAWNEVSRRYVDDEPEFYMPNEWRKRAENVKQGSSDEVATIPTFIVRIYYRMSLWLYKLLLWLNVCPEQARMILPQSMMTEWVWTGSLYGWARVYNLRTDEHAQRECQEVALQIGEHMAELFPHSWKVLTNG